MAALTLETCPSSEPMTTEVEPSAVVAASSETSGYPATFVGPLEADEYFAALADQQPASVQIAPEGEGESQFPDGSTPPVIVAFEAVHSSTYWILSGYVSDDISPANCVVEFGGYLAGRSVPVMSNGFFATFVPYDPSAIHEVTAIARDGNGNLSNLMSVTLWP